MPVPTTAVPVPARHLWHLLFDRVTCRVCGVDHTDDDEDAPCKVAPKIRPIAGFRQQQEGRA